MSKYRTIPAEEVFSKFPAERRARIEARAAELVAEVIALSELRKAKCITQAQLARKLGGKQVYVSRFEKRSDVKLSGLRKYVAALGGKLDLLVTFPDDGSAYALKGFKSRASARKKK